MTSVERRESTRQFINRWQGKGNEKQHSRSFWLEIFTNVLGEDNATQRLEFEKTVIVNGHTKNIDVYIPETHVLIEQKSLGIDLDKKEKQSDGAELTPYEQAKRYNDNLPYNEKARWIITSNFSDIWIYDMDSKVPTPFKLTLTELRDKFSKLDILAKKEIKKLTDEMVVSIKAGELVGLMYDAFAKQFGDMDNEVNQKALNVLCVRLVFCLYAEDADVFARKDQFHDYLEHYEAHDMRMALVNLFKTLSTPYEQRDPFLEPELADFPYVNGGLFQDDNPIIPPITEEIRMLLLDKASLDFDWSDISPTIFGAVFESTLNPETRRKGGMHYTSIENIHKLIDPLFLDDLEKELEEIEAIPAAKKRINALDEFQTKIAGLNFLDPACGSGNFLTETYISLRKLENKVITLKEAAQKGSVEGQISFGDLGADFKSPIKVSIQQFYGIEINDFAAVVAKTALWIAESQMMKETEDVLHVTMDFLPLKSYVNIKEDNALEINWETVIPARNCAYILGNPPFIGYSNQTKEQKQDCKNIFKGNKKAGKLDYVSCWYKKAHEYMKDYPIRAAFVSTNSICQGEQVATLWKDLFDKGLHIDFAYRSFKWTSEADHSAQVSVIIIGFSKTPNPKPKKIFDGDDVISVSNINAYLIDGDDIFVEARRSPLNPHTLPAVSGLKPADGGHLILDEEAFLSVKDDEKIRKWLRPFSMGGDFINGKKRCCLWLKDISPKEIRECKFIKDRVDAVREFRLKSSKEATRKRAETPHLFEDANKNIDVTKPYIAIPQTSSSTRRYFPVSFITNQTIPGDAIRLISKSDKYTFGILCSNVHMAWTRIVAGRLGDGYRYINTLVYNNFPWPTPTDDQKAKIEQSAQAILDARVLYPDSSLADLYDPLTMPPELRKAHVWNDKNVMAAYGFSTKMTEADCVAELMKMYQQQVESQLLGDDNDR